MDPESSERPPEAEGVSSGESTRVAPGVLYLRSSAEADREVAMQLATAIAAGGPLVVAAMEPTAVDAAGLEESGNVRTIARPSRLTPEWLDGVVNEYGVSTVVNAGSGSADATDDARAVASCDCTLLTVNADEHTDSISSLLVPVESGPHLDATLDAARTIAENTGAWIDLFYVPESDERDRGAVDAGDASPDAAAPPFERCIDRLGSFEDFDTWVYEGPSPSAAIVEQSSYYDVTILGATGKGLLREMIAGSTTRAVLRGAENTVLTVRNGTREPSRLQRWLGDGG